MNLDTLLAAAVERKASDIHLTVGQPPVLRIGGKLERIPDAAILSAASLEAMVLPVLPEMVRASLLEGAVPFAETVVRREGIALEFHLCVFRAGGAWTATFRIVSGEIPSLPLIGHDAQGFLEQLATQMRGLVLFTGATGSGKATTAASVIETINQTREERIFILETFAGYRFQSKKSLVTTLHIGQDFDTMERAAQVLLRADPDVVYFGDLPTQESVRQALLLAETGHLVFAVLNADSAAGAIENLIAAFPEPREAIRGALARTLLAVINQRLLPRIDKQGRAPAYEILQATTAVREQIQQGVTAAALNAAMEEGQNDGHVTLSAALERLVAAGKVSAETARLYQMDRVDSAM